MDKDKKPKRSYKPNEEVVEYIFNAMIAGVIAQMELEGVISHKYVSDIKALFNKHGDKGRGDSNWTEEYIEAKRRFEELPLVRAMKEDDG